MTRDASYFGNEIVSDQPDERRVIVRCGCGCGEDGLIADSAIAAFARHYGNAFRGWRLVLPTHGDGLQIPAGGTFYLCHVPPSVVYVDAELETNGRLHARLLAAQYRADAPGRALA